MQTYKVTNPEAFRIKICGMLAQRLLGAMEGSINVQVLPENTRKIVINLEKGIFNFCIQEATKKNLIKKWENSYFVHLYVDRLRSVYMNLKHQSLKDSILTGSTNPKDVAFMTHQQFDPEKWEDLLAQKQKRDASKFTTNIQAMTDVYQCKRCKSRKCVYQELQVRSADESMTIFVTCLDCGKQWKC